MFQSGLVAALSDLVHLVCFVDLVDLVHLVSLIQPKNQTHQINKTNQRDQIDQMNQTDQAPFHVEAVGRAGSDTDMTVIRREKTVAREGETCEKGAIRSS